MKLINKNASVFLMNGTVIQGIVKKYSAKKCYLKAENGNEIIINRPRKNILMVKINNIVEPIKEQVKETINNVLEQSEPLQKPDTVKVGQVWKLRNYICKIEDVVFDGISWWCKIRGDANITTFEISADELLKSKEWILIEDINYSEQLNNLPFAKSVEAANPILDNLVKMKQFRENQR